MHLQPLLSSFFGSSILKKNLSAVLGLASAATISTFYKADAWAGALLFPNLVRFLLILMLFMPGYGLKQTQCTLPSPLQAWTCFATTLINSSLLSSNPSVRILFLHMKSCCDASLSGHYDEGVCVLRVQIVASAQRLAALKPFASVSSPQSQPSVANKPEAAGHAGQGVPLPPVVDAAKAATDRRQPESGMPCSWQRKDLRVRAPSAKAHLLATVTVAELTFIRLQCNQYEYRRRSCRSRRLRPRNSSTSRPCSRPRSC